MSDSATSSPSIEFKGNAAQQERAELILELFRARGAFFAATAPITLPVSTLAETLEAIGKGVTPRTIESTLDENDHVFLREESGDDVTYTTTKHGVAPGSATSDDHDDHSLAHRFTTPEPPRERARPRSSAPETVDETDARDSVAPMEFPPDSWQAAVAAALREASDSANDVVISDTAMTDDAITVEDVALDEDEVVSEAAQDLLEDVAAPEIEEIAQDEPEAAETVETSEPVQIAPEPVDDVDVSSASDDAIADAIEIALRDEPDAIRWGELWMHASNVPELAADDVNKIEEIIAAASEAVSDYALVRDLRPDETPGSETFELQRFAVNHRLSQESSRFEFVGTGRQSLWTSGGTQAISTDKRSLSDIGRDYRFLLDYRTPDAEMEPGIVEHVLTFYEHRLGVLPLNANFASILPKAAFNDQRATRLTFESPQTFESFDVDLRYATSSQGGFLVGFADFFSENLVPGAVVTIEATRDRETHFIIEYFQISRQDRKLLQFNERRNQFVFQSTTYFCATQDDMLVDDNHFERLGGIEPLDDEELRHVDRVVRATFERVGTRTGDDEQFRAHILDLLAGANIERPISEPFLRDILSGGAFLEFVADDTEEDVFIYVPQAD